MKILTDTMQVNGKWSQKRVMVFSSFFVATLYAFMPSILPTFDVKEFVFLGFVGAGGYGLYRVQKKNENNIQDTE